MKCHQVLALTDTTDKVGLAVLCLVMSVKADLADPNVLLHLTEYLALLCLTATLELGTGSHSMVREHLLLLLAEPCVGLQPTDLANVLAGCINSQLQTPLGTILAVLGAVIPTAMDTLLLSCL